MLFAALGDLRRSCCNPREPRHQLRLRAGTVCVAMISRCSKCVKVKDVVDRDRDGGEFFFVSTAKVEWTKVRRQGLVKHRSNHCRSTKLLNMLWRSCSCCTLPLRTGARHMNVSKKCDCSAIPCLWPLLNRILFNH
jgi:hypothetical protein